MNPIAFFCIAGNRHRRIRIYAAGITGMLVVCTANTGNGVTITVGGNHRGINYPLVVVKPIPTDGSTADTRQVAVLAPLDTGADYTVISTETRDALMPFPTAPFEIQAADVISTMLRSLQTPIVKVDQIVSHGDLATTNGEMDLLDGAKVNEHIRLWTFNALGVDYIHHKHIVFYRSVTTRDDFRVFINVSKGNHMLAGRTSFFDNSLAELPDLISGFDAEIKLDVQMQSFGGAFGNVTTRQPRPIVTGTAGGRTSTGIMLDTGAANTVVTRSFLTTSTSNSSLIQARILAFRPVNVGDPPSIANATVVQIPQITVMQGSDSIVMNNVNAIVDSAIWNDGTNPIVLGQNILEQFHSIIDLVDDSTSDPTDTSFRLKIADRGIDLGAKRKVSAKARGATAANLRFLDAGASQLFDLDSVELRDAVLVAGDAATIGSERYDPLPRRAYAIAHDMTTPTGTQSDLTVAALRPREEGPVYMGALHGEDSRATFELPAGADLDEYLIAVERKVASLGLNEGVVTLPQIFVDTNFDAMYDAQDQKLYGAVDLNVYLASLQGANDLAPNWIDEMFMIVNGEAIGQTSGLPLPGFLFALTPFTFNPMDPNMPLGSLQLADGYAAKALGQIELTVPVPEPATATLLVAAIVGGFAAAHRRAGGNREEHRSAQSRHWHYL